MFVVFCVFLSFQWKLSEDEERSQHTEQPLLRTLEDHSGAFQLQIAVASDHTREPAEI